MQREGFVLSRIRLDPATAYGRHPLQPHQQIDRVTPTEGTILLCHLGVPRIDPDDWSVPIDGLVREADLSERCRHFADGPILDIDCARSARPPP